MSEITIENLQVGYAGRTVIDQLDLRFAPGKITALIGPNGCGKSTLLKTIARVLTPSRGRVWLQQQDVHRTHSQTLARQMALLPQAPSTPEGVSVRELVAYGRAPWVSRFGRLTADDWQVVDRALLDTGLDGQAGQLATELSGGQRQRAWIAMILAQQTDLILLDEPTTWLDMSHQVELLKLLRQLNDRGKTLIVVLHDLNQACRYCDELVVLADGRLRAQGAPDAVFTDRLLEEVFALPARVVTDPVAGSPFCVPL